MRNAIRTMIPAKRIERIIWFILLFTAVVSVTMGCINAVIRYNCVDFQYDSAWLLLNRINPYTESITPTDIADRMGLKAIYGPVEAPQFPSLLVILFPYAMLSPFAANVCWTATNLICTAVIIFLLRKLFFADLLAWEYSFLVLLILAGTPWRSIVGVGQHTIFAFTFFLLALYFRDKNKLAAGLFLAISFFKYTLTVPLALYYIYRKEYKILAYSVIPHVLLTIWAAIWLKAPLTDMVVLPLRIASRLESEGSIDVGSMFHLKGGAGLAVMFFMGVLLFSLAVIKGNSDTISENKDETVWIILIMGALICTYHRNYDFFVSIIPMVYMLKRYHSKWIRIMWLWIVIVEFFGYTLAFRDYYGIHFDAVYFYCEKIAGIFWYILMLFVIVETTVSERLKNGR